MSLVTIIMAGGLGKRMKSEKPKVLHLVKGTPMIFYVIKQAFSVGSQQVLVVVGKYKEQIKNEIELWFSSEECAKIEYVIQSEVLVNNEMKVQGTGDAIKCCIDFFRHNSIDLRTNVLILSGDVPLIQKETIERLLLRENTLLITQLENPTGCGRIVFSGDELQIDRIVEEKDCNEDERKIQRVNCGIYNLTVDVIVKYIPMIKNENKNQEYYLTDIIQIMRTHDMDLNWYELPKENQYEIININTEEELRNANQYSFSE